MIEWFEAIDRWIVLSVNGWNTPVLDEIMWFISGKLTWVPLYLYLFYLGFKKLPSGKFIPFLLFVFASIALSDLISSGLFKEFFQRYRPSHNELIKHQLHLYEESKKHFYTGGKYGFVSSHAANFFALALSIGLGLRSQLPKLLWVLITLAIVVSLSRIYLGVHYLSDVVGGAMVGFTVSYVLFRLLQRSKYRL